MLVTAPDVVTIVFVLALGVITVLPACPKARQLETVTATICVNSAFAVGPISESFIGSLCPELGERNGSGRYIQMIGEDLGLDPMSIAFNLLPEESQIG